jgi:hypothetical protein
MPTDCEPWPGNRNTIEKEALVIFRRSKVSRFQSFKVSKKYAISDFRTLKALNVETLKL